MPRKARIDAPGALQHIIIRGIERRAIFKVGADYKSFLQRLGKILSESSTPCYAWALMHNHAHLLLRTGLVPLSIIMRRLLTGYAQQFNRRHRRHGQLFQNRYKSILCEEEAYFLELLRYIHLNPVRAGKVKGIRELNKYPWTGHSVLMGKVKSEWQNVDYVLRRFGTTAGAARKSYLAFVSKGVSMGRRPDLVGGGLIRTAGGWSALRASRDANIRIMGDERILGSSDFVESVLKQANEHFEQKTLALAKGIDLNKLMMAVCDHFNMDSALIKSSTRNRTVARMRSIICCLAVDQLKISGREVARTLKLAPSTVSKLAVRGRSDDMGKAISKNLFGFK